MRGDAAVECTKVLEWYMLLGDCQLSSERGLSAYGVRGKFSGLLKILAENMFDESRYLGSRIPETLPTALVCSEREISRYLLINLGGHGNVQLRIRIFCFLEYLEVALAVFVAGSSSSACGIAGMDNLNKFPLPWSARRRFEMLPNSVRRPRISALKKRARAI